MLTGCDAKLARAKAHLDQLQNSIAPFIHPGSAFKIKKEANKNAGQYVFKINVTEAPPLLDWSLLIGDCLHNARSALDHVFWCLVLKHHPNGISENTSAINFPILREPSTFKGRRQKLEGWVGKAVTNHLESLQPYNTIDGWQKNVLMFLHDFDVMDKHRLLLPAMHIMNGMKIKTQTVNNCDVLMDAEFSLMAFEQDSIIGRIQYHSPDLVIDVDIDPVLDVIFEGQPGPLRVIPTLTRTLEVVSEVKVGIEKYL